MWCHILDLTKQQRVYNYNVNSTYYLSDYVVNDNFLLSCIIRKIVLCEVSLFLVSYLYCTVLWVNFGYDFSV